MKYNVKINKETCINCSMCATLCSNVFEMKNGDAVVIKPDTDDEGSLEAKDACPVEAISVDEIASKIDNSTNDVVSIVENSSEEDRKIEKGDLISEVIKKNPEIEDVLRNEGLVCDTCISSKNVTIEKECNSQNINVDEVVYRINQKLVA
jgi:ferredoxin